MDLLLDTLEDLTVREMKKFKLFLTDETLEGYKRIPKGDLESTDPSDITVKMKEAYGSVADSLKMALCILKKMNRNDLVGKLEAGCKQELNQPSASAAAPKKQVGGSSKERVFHVRPGLISGVNRGVLGDLLVGLQANKPPVLSSRETEEVQQRHQVLQDQVTCLVDMVLKKGETACGIILTLLEKLDPLLYGEL